MVTSVNPGWAPPPGRLTLGGVPDTTVTPPDRRNRTVDRDDCEVGKTKRDTRVV